MLTIKYQTAFKRDYKRIRRAPRGELSIAAEKFDIISKSLQPLPEKFRDHDLTGNYKGCRECHILPDWLLVYEVNNDELILYLIRTGSHSDLF